MSDKKISDSQGSRRPCHGAKRRSFRGNQFTGDEKINQTSSAAKKLKSGDAQFDVQVIPSAVYVIVHWSLFLSLQKSLICRVCKGNVTFGESNMQGLGFNLNVMCKCNDSQSIPSSPKIHTGFEINRRMVYVRRLLGVGFNGLKNFCGLLDISCSGLSLSRLLRYY